MIPVEVVGVRLEVPSNQPVLLLRERDGQRYLPIWIGASEATAIAMAQGGVEPPRPLTHDLAKTLLAATGLELTRVEITELRDGVFFANLILSDGQSISARPSDAIALAVRTSAATLVAADVLDMAGVAAPPDEDTEVEAFRAFLDEVSPEDFSGSGSQ